MEPDDGVEDHMPFERLREKRRMETTEHVAITYTSRINDVPQRGIAAMRAPQSGHGGGQKVEYVALSSIRMTRCPMCILRATDQH